MSTNYDWTTFSVSEVGFGDLIIPVALGAASLATNVPFSYLGTNFQVQIQAGIRPGSGQVYADFYSIDPATSLPPPVNIGFLPPEDGTGRGQGHVTYTIRAKAGLPTGAQLANVALISFDLEPQIATDQVNDSDPAAGIDPSRECLLTIDSTPPTSAVLPLPAVQTTTNFVVTWSGTDVGSGIAVYDIYLSVNGSAWTLWQAQTTNTGAQFSAATGNTYSFYSVATDNVGNREADHATADATTMIVSTVPTVSLGGNVWYYPTNYPASQPSSNGVGGVSVNLSGGLTTNEISGSDGSYSFSGLAVGQDYEVSVAKSDDTPVANGVTTLDIALIRRQVLGLAPLGSPYELLAADVNASGTVDTLDIALIRRLILALTNTFPAGLWRFVPADYVFPNPANPWAVPTN
ncbi:MAG: dockerin type I domain-containing protein, partial [Limisphaerales bacterium]